MLQTGLLPAGNDAGLVISNDYNVKTMTRDGFARTERRKGFYTQAREASPALKYATDAAFGRYLKKRGASRDWVARQRGWQLPALEQCRAEWEMRFPATEWETDGSSWRGERDANWATGDDDDV